MQDLEKRIMNADLTKTQSVIAQYIIENKSRVCFMTVADIASKLDTSDASVIRTARAIGYSGFNEMQKDIQSEISYTVRYASNSILTPAEKLISNMDILNSGDLAKELLTSAIKNLEVTFTNNTIEKIDQISDMLIHSKRKFFVGFRGSASIVNILAMSISHLIPNITKIEATDFSAFESVVDITSSDCLFIANFPRYPKIIDVLVDMAKKAGASIILMTEGVAAPHARDADILIPVSVDSISFFNSYIAPIFIAELISTDVAKKLGTKSERRMKTLDNAVAKGGLY